MRILVKILKIPTLVVSIIFIVGFTALLVLGFFIPFGKSYESAVATEYEGVPAKTIGVINFLKDNRIYIKSSISYNEDKLIETLTEQGKTDEYIAEAIANSMEVDVTEGFYVIKDGKLYFDALAESVKDVKKKEAFAEIKGCKITKTVTTENGEEIYTYVCTTNALTQLISIVGLSVGGVLLSVSILFIVLSAKRIIRY